jgi:hypothetical protein
MLPVAYPCNASQVRQEAFRFTPLSQRAIPSRIQGHEDLGMIERRRTPRAHQ